jgi:hypothetical protein
VSKTLLLLLNLALVSCSFNREKIPNEKELLKQELSKINWKTIDKYPYSPICDSVLDNEQKVCFENYLSQEIQNKLDTITSSTRHLIPVDTVEIVVTINRDDTVEFNPNYKNITSKLDTLKLDSIISRKLINFPTIKAATKKGIKVKTQFKIPLIIKSASH